MTSSTTTASAPDALAHRDGGADEAPRVLSLRTVHDGWGRFLVARIRLGDGDEIDCEVEDHGTAVAVLPYDPERREALLMRQLRAPALVGAGLATTLEAPAGRQEGADPAACAAREAFEECGVVLGALDALARLADGGALPDTKTMLLFALRHRRPDLFTRQPEGYLR